MAKQRLVKCLCLLALPAALLCGCWDALDINDTTILTAVLVDRSEYGYKYYVEIPKITGAAKEQAPPTERKTTVLMAEGRNTAEARNNLEQMLDRPAFLGAVQSVVFTEQAARCGIEEYMLRLRQTPDYRKTAHVVVTTEDPMKLLTNIPENDFSTGFAINDTLESLTKTGQLHHVTLLNVLNALSSPYPRYLLPTMALVSNEPAFTGFSVFSGGIKTGFIPRADIDPICLILAEKPKLQYVVPYKETHAAVEVELGKKKIKAYYENGKPGFDLFLDFNARLLYPEKDRPMTNLEMEQIRQTLRSMLEREFVRMFTESVGKYEIDVFQLYRVFRITFPDEYKKMIWAEEYPKSRLYLSVAVKLKTTEALDYSPQEQ